LDESVISLSLFTPDIDLFDLNRVETLRGPQGTLFGSGSVGGTIRYITNRPRLGVIEGQVEGNVNVVEEDDVGGHLKGAINIPIGDTLAVRAVGYYTQYAGFVDALREGGGRNENVNDGQRYGGRIALHVPRHTGPSCFEPEIKAANVVANKWTRASQLRRQWMSCRDATCVGSAEPWSTTLAAYR
jgi:hypothetical protein